jgi:quercetin 2,3-dioxygenase
MAIRSIDGVRAATREDFNGLLTFQAIPSDWRDRLNPFLLLAHHGPQQFPAGNRGLPFGPHPHRGFETVTFIREGMLAHHDTGGHESIIGAGGVQWMTAGSGLIHAEVSPDEFKRDGGRVEILQLWVNLPSRLKMSDPRYIGVQDEAVEEVGLDGDKALLRLVSGRFDGRRGPIESLTGVFMSTLDLHPHAKALLPAPRGQTVLFYVVAGTVEVGGKVLGERSLVHFADDGDSIEVTAREPASLLYAHADPIEEQVVQRGPFVMSSDDEIMQAYADLKAGKFDGTPISLEID